MNEDRIVGAGRELLGRGERAVGDGIGDNQLKGDGVADQVAGAVQHGYGVVTGAAGEIVHGAPGAVADAVDRGRQLVRKSDAAVRDQLGERGPLYLIGGAIAIFALGAFAVARSKTAQVGKSKPAAVRRSKPKPTSAA